MSNLYDTAHPQRRISPAEPPSLAAMLMLALALFALILPIVGPLDDHHFSERSHSHGHIYLDGRPVAHQHAFDAGLRHRHTQAPPAKWAETPQTAQTSIAYFTNAASSLLLTIQTAPWHRAPEAMKPPPANIQDTNPLSPYPVGRTEPEGLKIVPAVPPPIA